MLFLSQNIIRMLVRLNQTIEKDVENGIVYPYIVYPSDVAKNRVVHVGKDTTITQKKNFDRFKKSLEDGTNLFMRCDDIDKEKSMIGIVNDINRFLEPFECVKILNIVNETVISKALVKKLETILQEKNPSSEAVALMLFLKNSRSSSWGQLDESCGSKKFVLVNDENEYKNILKEKNVKEFTEQGSKIHLAFCRISENEVIQEKGLQWDFKRFARENEYNKERIDGYKKWYGIRTKGIYYVYIPDSIF